MTDQNSTNEPAGKIIEAIAQLQAAFCDAGLCGPVALVLAGDEQKLRLESLFRCYLAYPGPWESMAIRGMKVLCNVPA